VQTSFDNYLTNSFAVFLMLFKDTPKHSLFVTSMPSTAGDGKIIFRGELME